MADKRKTQVEIERILKKATDGAETLDNLLDQIRSTSDIPQKEKIESELKKEARKLKKSREQLIGFCSGSEAKNKSLVETIQIIDEKIEQFKALETKPKQPQKEGTNRTANANQEEQERNKQNEFIDEIIARLNAQISEYENQKGRKKTDNHSFYLSVINRHRWHIFKLEKLRQRLQHNELHYSQFDEVQDKLSTYLASHHNPEYFYKYEESFDIYESLQLEEYPLPTGVQTGDEANKNYANEVTLESEEGDDTLSQTGAGGPGNNQVVGKKKSKKNPPTTGLQQIQQKNPKKSSTFSVDGTNPEQLTASKQEQQFQNRNSTNNNTNQGTTDTEQNKNEIKLQNNEATNSKNRQNEATKNLNYEKRNDQNEDEHHSEDDEEEEDINDSDIVNEIHKNWNDNENKFQEETKNNKNLKNMQKDAFNQTQNSILERSVNLPQIIDHPMVQSSTTIQNEIEQFQRQQRLKQQQQQQQQQQQVRPNSQPTTNDPLSEVKAMLNLSMTTCPQKHDLERPQPYVPQNPCVVHPSFPTNPAAIFDSTNLPALFERFSADTLFFIFYYQKNSQHRFLAARELKKQSWRFHKLHRTWFQRHEEPQVTNSDFEKGTYVYFDDEHGWSQRIKHDFIFDYKYLEDELN